MPKTSGSFKVGDPRCGRPKGSKTRLTNSFLNDALAEWEAGGKDALRIFRIEEPAKFCMMISSLVPRELMLETVASELSDDELDAQINFIREQLAKPQSEPLMIEAKVNGAAEPVER
jgi:hypothetical protein